jgi:hypothetical protein
MRTDREVARGPSRTFRPTLRNAKGGTRKTDGVPVTAAEAAARKHQTIPVLSSRAKRGICLSENSRFLVAPKCEGRRMHKALLGMTSGASARAREALVGQVGLPGATKAGCKRELNRAKMPG